MEAVKKDTWAHVLAFLAAIGASMCCILPVAVALLGIGSAALGAKLEPFRPYFIVLTLCFLGYAFYQAYKPSECKPGDSCAIPESRRRHRIMLWVVTFLAVLLMTFPYYVSWLF